MDSRDHDRRIEEFTSVFLATMGATSAPGVPEPMRSGPASASGWYAWHPVDSTVTQEDIASLEGSVGASLPPLFVKYLTHKCLLMTDFGILSLPELRCDRPLREISEYFNLMERQPYWRSKGYVPFGQDGDGEGVLAFDIKRPDDHGDYPVMYVDPELMGRPGYIGIEKWSGFSHLLDDVQKHLEGIRRAYGQKSQPTV